MFFSRITDKVLKVNSYIYRGLFYYKYREMKKRVDSYKRQISSYGLITLCYLITYYEDLEDFEECSIILKAIKEHCELNQIKDYPTRYDLKSVQWYLKRLSELQDIPKSNIAFNIKGYASEVRKIVERECS